MSATRVHEAYQSFFPPDVYYVADHARRSMSEYPLAKGHYYGVDYGERGARACRRTKFRRQLSRRIAASRNATAAAIPDYAPNDLSFYANIPVPTSYMCMGSQEDFFGGYDYKAQAGIVHVANHHISPGKKQWTWGNHEFGYAWDRNLTDRTPTANTRLTSKSWPAFIPTTSRTSASSSPVKPRHGASIWYPIQKIGPAQHANLDAAVSLAVVERKSRLGVSVTAEFPGAKIRLTGKGQELLRSTATLRRASRLSRKLKLPRGVARNGSAAARRRCRRKTKSSPINPSRASKAKCRHRPPNRPRRKHIASADELYITGLHLDQYRHATRCPAPYWREALRRDPLDARCNNAMGLWHLRRGEFCTGRKLFPQSHRTADAPQRQSYDGEALLQSGPVLAPSWRADDEAYAAFYKAMLESGVAIAPAYHALAEIDCRPSDWTTALDHI